MTTQNKVWIEEIEVELIKQIGSYCHILWEVRELSDIGPDEAVGLLQFTVDFRDVFFPSSIKFRTESLNSRFVRTFEPIEVAEKWLELCLLFDCKYAINDYTMEDPGHHIRRDGSLKDDLNESWKYFKLFSFLANPNARLKKIPREERKKKYSKSYL